MNASFAQQEVWHVMLAGDDLKRMNVDQLDDAFRLDLVDTSTLVWKTGMEGWRRLGSVAGIDDEPETIARPLGPPGRPFGPPAPPPPPRPKPQARSVAPEINPFLSTAANPFASTTPAGVFAAPQLMAPVYTPPLYSPDPYVLPKRRVKIPSEVDFRRASGVRWGRWLFGFLLLTAGVLGAYRQDYLRQGARRLGVENKYVHGERRVTGYVTAKAPYGVKVALTRLALLPGPNALAEAPAKVAAQPAPVVAAAAAAPATEPTQASTPTKTEPDVKTVSLDSLPVLAAEQAEPAAPPARAPAAAPAPRAGAVAAVVARPAPKAAKKEPAEERTPTPQAKAEPKPEPKAAPKGPPPQMNDTPLKAAIWQAMQDSAKKGK